MAEVKELLDEAAAFAVGDRAINASEVIQRARHAEHRAGVRRSAVALAAVIAVLVGLVLVPRMTLRAAPKPAAPTLPPALTLPPLDTPTLSQAPIPAASLVLSVHAGWRRPSSLNGYVAVSAADGSYRRLNAVPSSVHDIKLSDDGRFLAWGEPFTGNFATERAVMHVLRLGDGVEREFALPYHGKFSTVQDFLWSPDGSRLYVSGMDGRIVTNRGMGAGGDSVAWTLDPARGTTTGPTQCGLPVVITKAGPAYRDAYSRPPGAALVPSAFRDLKGEVITEAVPSPDGASLAGLVQGYKQTPGPFTTASGPYTRVLVVDRHGHPTSLSLPPPVPRAARLMGWWHQGIILAIPDGPSGGSSRIRLNAMDPRTGAERTLTVVNVPPQWSFSPWSLARPSL